MIRAIALIRAETRATNLSAKIIETRIAALRQRETGGK